MSTLDFINKQMLKIYEWNKQTKSFYEHLVAFCDEEQIYI